MKTCPNCVEPNSDGASECVICGDKLDTLQVSETSIPEVVINDVNEVGLVVEVKEIITPPPFPPEAALPEAPSPLPEVASEAVEAIETALTTPVAVKKPVEKVALFVYHDTESRVVHIHPVVNDITLVGREDPQGDIFPDLDLSKLISLGVTALSASRQHLRLIRQGCEFFLFIYRGSTGTQVNKELIEETRYGRKFPISVGDRIILGGKVRLKLTVIE